MQENGIRARHKRRSGLTSAESEHPKDIACIRRISLATNPLELRMDGMEQHQHLRIRRSIAIRFAAMLP